MTNRRVRHSAGSANRRRLAIVIGLAVALMVAMGGQPAGAASPDPARVLGADGPMRARGPDADADDSDEEEQVETEEMIEADRRRSEAWWAQIAELLAQAPKDSGAFPVSPPANLLTGEPLSASENWELLSQDQLRLILEDPQLPYLLGTGDFFDTRPEDDVASGESILTIIETSRAIEDCTADQVRELNLTIAIDGLPPVIVPGLDNYPLNGATKVAALACVDGTTDLKLFDAGANGDLVPDTSGHVQVASWPMDEAPDALVADARSDDSHFYVFLTDPDVTSQQPWNGWVTSGTDDQLDPSTFWVSSYEGLAAGTIDADLAESGDEETSGGNSEQSGADNSAGAGTSGTSGEDGPSGNEIALLVIALIAIPALSFGGYRLWRNGNPAAMLGNDPADPSEGEAMLGDGKSDDGFIS